MKSRPVFGIARTEVSLKFPLSEHASAFRAGNVRPDGAKVSCETTSQGVMVALVLRVAMGLRVSRS